MALNAVAAAEKLRDEILKKLEDVFYAVFDGPDMSGEQVELLSLLSADDLKDIASEAEECVTNVRCYATLARDALAAKDH